uniref:Uncharacterized protein n=1 Tax=Varanus komodoensis TaxID=61221 RepID=A0A8D2LTU6_VARKO
MAGPRGARAARPGGSGPRTAGSLARSLARSRPRPLAPLHVCFRRANAALEARTAELVRQAEEVLVSAAPGAALWHLGHWKVHPNPNPFDPSLQRDQQEKLSRPVSTPMELFDEEAKHQR